jgi:hypothetical protein
MMASRERPLPLRPDTVEQFIGGLAETLLLMTTELVLADGYPGLADLMAVALADCASECGGAEQLVAHRPQHPASAAVVALATAGSDPDLRDLVSRCGSVIGGTQPLTTVLAHSWRMCGRPDDPEGPAGFTSLPQLLGSAVHLAVSHVPGRVVCHWASQDAGLALVEVLCASLRQAALMEPGADFFRLEQAAGRALPDLPSPGWQRS